MSTNQTTYLTFFNDKVIPNSFDLLQLGSSATVPLGDLLRMRNVAEVGTSNKRLASAHEARTILGLFWWMVL